ncbi:DUF421 domain-containing protein [Marinicrinis lubricantis]|uniref:DUF421 domain-containing protein n=1 Tax=Marinicrinis lubricantis TaxID=2086470 RepID=A0ABW1IUN7_9BACL
MDLLTIFFRTVIVYFLVFLLLRLMGKREIGKLSVFDLVISIMIAEVAIIVVDNPDKPMLEGILPMLVLVSIQIMIAYITLKNRKLRRLFDGKPSAIIENGHLNREEMAKQKYNLDDLMQQLRQNNLRNVADVEFAYLETNGKLTVIQKNQNQNQQNGSSSNNPHGIRYEGLPIPLIMDGKVQDQNLEKIQKTRFWLKNEIQKKGLHDFKEIFLCTLDHKGRLFIDKKKR